MVETVATAGMVETAVTACTKLCEQVREDMASEGEGGFSVRDFLARAQRDSLVRQLLVAMEQAHEGLERLAVTYSGDCATVARLDVLGQRLRSVTAKLNERL